MAYGTPVQYRSAVVTGSDTVSLSFNTTPSVGNLVLVVAATYDGDIGTSAVSDNQSNTYTRRSKAEGIGSTPIDVVIFETVVGTASGTFTITVDPTGSSADITLFIVEFSGNAASPFDQQNTGSANSTSASSGTATPTENGELWVGAMTHDGSDRTLTETNGMPLYENEGGSSNIPLAVVYKVQSTATGEAATWTIGTGSVVWAACIATFKSSGGGTTESYRSKYPLYSAWACVARNRNGARLYELIELATRTPINDPTAYQDLWFGVDATTYEETMGLDKGLGDARTSELTAEAEVPLGIELNETAEAGVVLDSGLTLDRAAGDATVSEKTVDSGLTLDREAGDTEDAALTTEGAVTLGRQDTDSGIPALDAIATDEFDRANDMVNFASADVNATVPLARSETLVPFGGITINDNLTLAATEAITTDGEKTADVAAAFGKTLGEGDQSVLEATGDIALVRKAGDDGTNLAVVESGLVLGQESGVSFDVAPEDTVSFGRNAGVSMTAEADVGAGTELSRAESVIADSNTEQGTELVFPKTINVEQTGGFIIEETAVPLGTKLGDLLESTTEVTPEPVGYYGGGSTVDLPWKPVYKPEYLEEVRKREEEELTAIVIGMIYGRKR